MNYPRHTINVDIDMNANIEEVIAGLCTTAMLTRSKLTGQFQGVTLIVGPGDHAHKLLEKFRDAKRTGRIRPIIMETAA